MPIVFNKCNYTPDATPQPEFDSAELKGLQATSDKVSKLLEFAGFKGEVFNLQIRRDIVQVTDDKGIAHTLKKKDDRIWTLGGKDLSEETSQKVIKTAHKALKDIRTIFGKRGSVVGPAAGHEADAEAPPLIVRHRADPPLSSTVPLPESDDEVRRKHQETQIRLLEKQVQLLQRTLTEEDKLKSEQLEKKEQELQRLRREMSEATQEVQDHQKGLAKAHEQVKQIQNSYQDIEQQVQTLTDENLRITKENSVLADKLHQTILEKQQQLEKAQNELVASQAQCEKLFDQLEIAQRKSEELFHQAMKTSTNHPKYLELEEELKKLQAKKMDVDSLQKKIVQQEAIISENTKTYGLLKQENDNLRKDLAQAQTRIENTTAIIKELTKKGK